MPSIHILTWLQPPKPFMKGFVSWFAVGPIIAPMFGISSYLRATTSLYPSRRSINSYFERKVSFLLVQTGLGGFPSAKFISELSFYSVWGLSSRQSGTPSISLWQLQPPLLWSGGLLQSLQTLTPHGVILISLYLPPLWLPCTC